jgi:DNA gyrase subunit A
MCITSQGKSIKLKVNEVRIMGRSAQGVRLLSIDKPDFVTGLDRIVKEDDTSPPAGDKTQTDNAVTEEPAAEQEQLNFDEN